jgi:putative ABC transport system permease protein
MKNDNPTRLSWLFLMAWRDSRRNRSRLFLFISSVVLGIAALVATLSFGNNLRSAIDDQAKALVGADLIIQSNQRLTAPVLALPDSVPNRHSLECNFSSMVYFVKSGGSRLVQVRALDGDYPFYGVLETTPVGAGQQFRKGRQALVDKTLMLQYGAKVGDSIRVGDLSFAIAGGLVKAPGRNEISTTVVPPVYIPLRWLDQAGLLKRGSRVFYQQYYQFGPLVDMDKLVAAIGPRLDKAGVHYETVASRKERMSRAFADLTQFLTLISFIALLLGCIGVASAVHIYIREKVSSIAVLRCLGLKGRQAFLIYLIQVAGIGVIGSVAGTVLGVLIQQVLPAVLKDLLPLETGFRISWPAIGQGVATGMVVSILFALLPLLSIRKISPLYTLRLSVEPAAARWDPLKALVYVAILFFIAWFSFVRMQSWSKALVFTGSIMGAFLLLGGAAMLLMWMVRRFFPARWNYLWRQGFANLYRPNNQTLILVVTIGLGTTFIGTLYFVQRLLIERVSAVAGNSQGNMVLFDIQPDQRSAIDGLAKQNKIRVLQEMPVVTLRVTKIRGFTVEQATDRWDRRDREGGRAGRGDGAGRGRGAVGRAGSPGDRADGGVGSAARAGGKDAGERDSVPKWAFGQELRVTYRDSLTASEKLVAGKPGSPVRSPQDPVLLSLDEEYAGAIRVTVGDSMLFNVQGLPVAAVVGSLRHADRRQLQGGFPIVFPTGVLEQAPQFFVTIARVSSPEVSARFQQAVVRSCPNVSMIDLGLVLNILDDILGKIGFVIRFMAAFSILTGVVVLIASVLISKYQRIQESVLLRTLGASRRQVLLITMLEYFFLGALAAAIGIGLSLGFSLALAHFIFESTFSPQWWPVGLLFVSVCGLTILIGLYNSRSVLNKPPLEILRSEA